MASTTNNPPITFMSSQDNFVPRKEFVSSSSRQSSSFALLSFSSNNVIRATNFSHHVFNELKARLHSVIGLRAYRENPEHKLGEIIILDKPWSNARSLSTEIVLVQVFAVLMGFGYSFVSKIDYGREPNDRTNLVFSHPSSRPAVHSEGNVSPSPSGVTTFGLSITSATSLRVVCSPLTGTPAILQSIRGAWPKGVKSEKKLGEHCYEFKLKGYSWFQEDTFSEDAPTHILTILSSLDKYAWSLVTSLNLSSSRSRTKDFLIFASHPDSSAHENIRSVSLINLGTPLKPNMFEPIEDGHGYASDGSEGSNTAAHSTEDLTTSPRPLNGTSQLPPKPTSSFDNRHKPRNGTSHLRVSSDTTGLNLPRQPPPPKPRVPLQLVSPMPIPIPPSFSPIIHLPSEPSPTGRRPPTHSLISLPRDAEDEPHSRANLDSNGAVNHGPTSEDHGVGSPPVLDDTPITPMSTLLVPDAFRALSEPENVRNSNASHYSDKSFEVPITWVPSNVDEDKDEDKDDQPLNPASEDEPKKILSSAFPFPSHNRGSSSIQTFENSDPVLPGGWVSTPISEVAQSPLPFEEDSNYTISNPLNGTLQRKATLLKEPTSSAIVTSSPRIIQPNSYGNGDYERSRRKSQFAVIRTVPIQTQIPPIPSRPDVTENASPERNDESTGSWVVVSRRAPVAGQLPENESSTPVTTVDSNKSVDDLQPTHNTGVKVSAAVHFVDQAASPTKSLPKDEFSRRRRKSSVISRLFGQPERKEEESDNPRDSIASVEEKKSPRKTRKLLPMRSRK